MEETITAVAEKPAAKPPRIINVGPDRVTIEDAQVVIEAKNPMPDWTVREYCRTPIWFQEQKYYLRQKRAAEKPYAMRYVLAPWSVEECGPTSAAELVYDAETVASRDQGVRMGRMEDIGKAFLLLFYPFVGFLWTRTKEKLARCGIVPRTVTGVSIMLEFGLVMLDGVFAKLLIMGSLRSGHLALGGILRAFIGQDYLNFGLFQVRVLWLDVVLFAFLLLDCVMRYGYHLADTENYLGVAEWIVRRKRKPVMGEAPPPGPQPASTS